MMSMSKVQHVWLGTVMHKHIRLPVGGVNLEEVNESFDKLSQRLGEVLVLTSLVCTRQMPT